MNAILIHVPKTGGRSIVVDFGFATMIDNFDQNKNKIRGRVSFGHIYIGELIKRNIISEDYLANSFTFSMVRNPFDRCVSLFFYIKYTTRGKKIVYEDMERYIAEFRLFCKCLNRICPIGFYNVKDDSQANTQTSWVTYNDEIFCDYIGRFEDYHESVKTIAYRLGANSTDQSSDIHESKVQKRFNYRDFYDESTADLVHLYYALDFDNFGYSKDVFA